MVHARRGDQSRLRRRGVAALVALLGATALAVPRYDATAATSTRIEVVASADAWIRSRTPDANGGKTPRLWAGGPSTDRRAFYVKFRVPAPPSGMRWTGATLRLVDDNLGTRWSGLAVRPAGNAWGETTLTWRNQPSAGTVLDRSGPYRAGSAVLLNVTRAVPGAGGVFSLRVATSESNYLRLRAREHASGGAPRLLLQAGIPPAYPTAAQTRGWGAPVASDEFNYTGAPDPNRWSVYNSVGHAGNGRRSPTAWHVGNGVVQVSGDAYGTTGGMSARFGRREYGRWEARMRTNRRDPQYHPVLILWPDSNNHCHGEIDYAEGTRDTSRIKFFLHHNGSTCEDSQEQTARVLDTTQWHTYAVEWKPTHIAGFIDGVEWFRDTNPSHLPPGPMHQTVQLDWFPGDGTGAPAPSWMQVDWVRVYNH